MMQSHTGTYLSIQQAQRMNTWRWIILGAVVLIALLFFKDSHIYFPVLILIGIAAIEMLAYTIVNWIIKRKGDDPTTKSSVLLNRLFIFNIYIDTV